jgi:hypothetical protein
MIAPVLSWMTASVEDLHRDVLPDTDDELRPVTDEQLRRTAGGREQAPHRVDDRQSRRSCLRSPPMRVESIFWPVVSRAVRSFARAERAATTPVGSKPSVSIFARVASSHPETAGRWPPYPP